MAACIEEKEIKLDNGLTLELRWYCDDCCMLPWEHCEIADKRFKGEWGRRGSNNYDYSWSKRPYEVIITKDCGSFVFYDFQDAVRNLRKQGCSGVEADRVARAEVKWLQDWFSDQWHYAGLVIECPGLPDFEPVSVWGYEYPMSSEDAEKELTSEALEQIREIQANFKPNFYPLATA
jgi:hypothetical protein